MVLTKRERLIAIVTLSVIIIFVLDRYVVTPFTEMNERIQIEKQDLVTEIERTARIFKQRKQVGNEWRDMIKGGLSSDASNTESRILHVIRKWSNDYGLTISSIKPDRNGAEGGTLKEIIFNVACKGSMDAIGRFLLEFENSNLPVRITEFQLGSREEDGRDMSLQLMLSAVYLAESEYLDAGEDDAVINMKVEI